MFILPKRRRVLYPLLMALALIVACGEGDICESDDARRNRQSREFENIRRLQALAAPTATSQAAGTPQVSATLQVTRLESVLQVPVTTYTATASAPAGAQITYEWSMSGETCGTPVTPWKQTGASVKWSHSDQPPDRCGHQQTNHAVTATVIVRAGANAVQCTLEGSENKRVDNPPCTPVTAAR